MELIGLKYSVSIPFGITSKNPLASFALKEASICEINVIHHIFL